MEIKSNEAETIYLNDLRALNSKLQYIVDDEATFYLENLPESKAKHSIRNFKRDVSAIAESMEKCIYQIAELHNINNKIISHYFANKIN